METVLAVTPRDQPLVVAYSPWQTDDIMDEEYDSSRFTMEHVRPRGIVAQR